MRSEARTGAADEAVETGDTRLGHKFHDNLIPAEGRTQGVRGTTCHVSGKVKMSCWPIDRWRRQAPGEFLCARVCPTHWPVIQGMLGMPQHEQADKQQATLTHQKGTR